MNEITHESSFEERAEKVLARTFRGIHHAPEITKRSDGAWTCCPSPMSTFDFDELTRLVLAAHQYAIRVQVGNGGPGRIKLTLTCRQRESENIYDRHPSIEQAIESFNK